MGVGMCLCHSWGSLGGSVTLTDAAQQSRIGHMARRSGSCSEGSKQGQLRPAVGMCTLRTQGSVSELSWGEALWQGTESQASAVPLCQLHPDSAAHPGVAPAHLHQIPVPGQCPLCLFPVQRFESLILFFGVLALALGTNRGEHHTHFTDGDTDLGPRRWS